MFLAINLLYLRDFLGIDTTQSIYEWTNYHLNSRNRFGFWGPNSFSYLQFQNGYHQYEILNYLGLVPSDCSYILNLSWIYPIFMGILPPILVVVVVMIMMPYHLSHITLHLERWMFQNFLY